MKNEIFINIYSGIPVQSLADELAAVKAWNFDGVELGLDAFPLVISGRINKPFVALLHDILNDFDLGRSAHIGLGLDLRNRESSDFHFRVLKTSLDICAELGLNPLVLHFEKDSGDPDTEARFREYHARAAEYASKCYVNLGLENIEIEHYRPVLGAVREINHPNLRMVLDTGHLFLASRYYGFSFEDAVTECAPYISHCHLNDNSGIFEQMRVENFDIYRTIPMGYRIAYGRGDIHMPPLYCNVPMQFVIRELKKAGFTGKYVCEYSHRLFEPFNAQICKDVRALVES